MQGEGGREGFVVGELHERGVRREGLDVAPATRHARAVAPVLVPREAVTTGEKDEYTEPFGARASSTTTNARRALTTNRRFSKRLLARRPPVFSRFCTGRASVGDFIGVNRHC